MLISSLIKHLITGFTYQLFFLPGAFSHITLSSSRLCSVVMETDLLSRKLSSCQDLGSISMTEQTLSADEDCVMQLKDLEEASKWTMSWGRRQCVSKVKDELSCLISSLLIKSRVLCHRYVSLFELVSLCTL